MALFPLPSLRTDVPARTEPGRKGVVFPSTGNQELPLQLPACRSCSKSEPHGQPCAMIGMTLPQGQRRHQNVPATQHAPAQFLHRLMSRLWELSYVANGVLRGTLFNLGAGTANNVSQQISYRIVSVVSSTRLRLRGRNPRLIKSPLSLTNPNWPMEAPAEMQPPDVSDEDWNGDPGTTNGMKYARLIPSGIFHSLPVGAAAEFQFPSILFNSCEPYIRRVYAPTLGAAADDVEFEVELSANVSAAMKPYDRAYPAAAYYLTFYYYAVAPENWPNWQPPVEGWLQRQERVFTREQLLAATPAGRVPLTGSALGGVRVPPPSLMPGALQVTIKRATFEDVPATDSMLQTTQTGTSFSTTIDLSPLLAHDDLQEVRVRYLCDAAAGAERTVPYQASCSNDQVDWTSSYDHSGGRVCRNAACQKFKDGNYVPGACWKTSTADGFAYGRTGAMPPADAGDSSWIAKLWSRCSLRLDQGLPGSSSHRNVSYTRPAGGGPSLQEMVGGLWDRVPGGVFPRREPVFYPRFGQRQAFSDENGANHRIVHGLFEARRYEANGDGTYSDNGASPAATVLVPGWNSRTGLRGTSMGEQQRLFPRGGPSPCGLYEFAPGGGSLQMAKRLSATATESYIAGVSATVRNPAGEAAIRAIV